MKKILVVFHPLNDGMKYIEEGGTQFAPHHFWCYDRLKDTGHQVDFLKTDDGPTFWNTLGSKIRINVLQQQLDCLRVAKEYDLIFIPFMEYSFLIALLKALKLFRKTVISISQFAYVPKKRNFLKRFKEMAVRWVYYKGTDLILYYCEPLFKRSEESKISGNTEFVAGWGVDHKFFNSFTEAQTEAPRADYIYSTGGSERDYHTLIKAFNHIDFELKITTVGNFEGHEDCEITPNILIDNSLPFGLGSTGIIRKEYYHALAIALPLQKIPEPEPFGITVLMEAMAMGKAVITTINPGFPFDVEEEKVGFIVDHGDVDGWRQAINYLINHPEEAKEMGQRARRLVAQRYNYRLFCERVNEQVIKLLPAERVLSTVEG